MKRKCFSDGHDIATSSGDMTQGTQSSMNPWTSTPYTSRYYEILSKRKQLPVFDFKTALEAAVRDNQVVIVEGETGSG
jgi:pre-mRNA-splicing factor ATP-dependent RNA helicase DHX15/PRP43